MEVLRRVSVAPVAVPHRAIVDVSIMGYFIPKDTSMLINLRSLHMDKDYWGDPEAFRPERFIDAAGQLKKDPENFLPFGTGRRRCMAESLARATLFMFISSLLLNFKFTPCPEAELPDCIEGRDGVTLTPLPYRGFVTPR
ncbi:hypothetical protein J437_LFUL008630 [Ladona fulva]|uniref:Cytochrome P450 n=1 Tax=Ladona fulva TaxID=123851 RepID=A0A8K0K6C1_LADFU|nr:hypothetical protein J437_LFUL008630 [Ladona fulva]